MDFCDVNPFVRNVIYVKAPMWEHYARKGTDCRIFYVSCGSMELAVGGEEHKIAKGGILYISSGCEYALGRYSGDFEHYVVNFDFTQDNNFKERAFFPKRSEEFEESCAIYAPAIDGFDCFGNFAIIKNCGSLDEIFRELHAVFLDKRYAYRYKSSAYMKLILSDIAERATAKNESSGNEIAEAAVAYIKKHYTDYLLDNEEISEYLGYSSFYVNKLVRKLTGKSIHRYLLLYRLAQAENLLIYSGKSVADIADECGFSAYDVFYSAFKREYGQTPTKFRQENRRTV